MANPRYNTQVTNQRGGSARVGKMGGGMMMQRPMYKKGGAVKKRGKDFMSASSTDKRKIAGRGGGADSGKAGEARSKAGVQEVRIKKGIKKAGKFAKKVGKAALMLTPIGAAKAAADAVKRVKKMGGGRIAGAARRAQEHGYYTPDMGMKGGRMFRDGGKVGKKKPRVKVIGIGKAKDYPGIKKIIEMNKKGKKRFKDGGSAMKPVDKSKNPGLAKLPTQVRNKMGYMKDGGKVKSKGSGHPLAGREGNVKHKLKSQKELKKITDSDAYKKADYAGKTKMLGGKVLRKDGGMAGRRNTRRMNRLEELGRVDAERGFTRKGKRNLKAEKKRIVKELKK